MSFRCIEYLTKLVFPTISRQQQFCRPVVTILLSNNMMEKSFQMRKISTETRNFTEKTGIFQGLVEKFKVQLKKYKVRAAGYYLYERTADQIDYMSFMKEFRMADTFHSWFLVTELHVWILMSILMRDAKFGRFLRNCVVEAMWEDVTARTKKIGPEQPSVVRGQVKIMAEEFQAALVNYDEGILSSDTVLAGSIWRRFLIRDPNCTVRDIEAMVKYIRKTMAHLDKWDLEEFLKNKKLNWIPLSDVLADLPR